MRSHPVKRVVSGALAAASVITLVTMAQPVATAAPVPVLQAPPPAGSDALAKYRDLAAQAEKLNEDLLRAQDDLTAKQGQLDKANADVDAAKNAGAQAIQAKQQYQSEVDKFAGASFTSGVQMNKLSALLAGTSTQDFLDRSAALEVIATDKNAAMGNLNGAAAKAQAAEKSAADAAKRAQDARDAAAKLASDIQAKKKDLQGQIDQIEAQSRNLSTSDKAAQKDTGGAAPTVKAPSAAAQKAVDAALSKLGSAYVWGATGPSTFDCSGLMQWAYKQAGITLPRNSAAQAGFGTPVSRDQLQPGDLVAYYSPVSHIGMYIGDGKMVHAPTSGDVVKISPLMSEYAGATRPTA
ncbi:NLP/P60-family protein [Amycolatopsis mediterranei S699]|uniref:NLP/P60-family protein n=2 Tax=Amycolatopsis mediterranei TaxID=33910 RepID=A0A0H3DBH0_AMYMU|nr:C40 family peptidase [Amycolatopsis mediterranei]ADJ47617.1 NLP/P60-family protein [Amycolatopsis mediterranei U32]AEK44500.1 NLP/P60-family protein [Amycolatopsis mediterranei S699]AFO79328.1 NLP/P60-family protein [Amycolatopsis mediterranei S699]AGT86456.1 NLP/P60-family protein [Amycolatopsis mediterranei RB]KDO11906.1 hydrolase Nlp/P60 [Amycolatopsis mediterranei]